MSGVWQINFVYESKEKSTFTITVPENCTAKEFFDALKNHTEAPSVDNVQLFSDNGDKRKPLVISSTERLSDYGIADKSSLFLVACVAERHWPTRKEIESISRTPEPADGITITTISDENPDVFGIEFDGPGVVMRCGHAVAPLSLALHCHSELEMGKSDIRCPECKDKWKFAHLKPAASLTPEEFTEFEAKAHINYLKGLQKETKSCPRCHVLGTRYRNTDKRIVCSNCSKPNTGKTFEFCWTCLREWKSSGTDTCGNPECGSEEEMFKVLETCQETDIAYCRVKAPAIRVCPKCRVPIHHDGGCKHMTCKICKYEFCFICLRKYVEGSTNLSGACAVAPRQTQETVGIVQGICEPDEQEQNNHEADLLRIIRQLHVDRQRFIRETDRQQQVTRERDSNNSEWNCAIQ